MSRSLTFLGSGFSPFDVLFVDMLSEHFDVTYLTLNPHPVLRFKSVKPNVVKSPLTFTYSVAALRPFDYLVSWPSLRSAIFRSKPDVVVGCYATTYGFLAALSGFRPLVLMAFGSDVLLDPLHPVKSRAVRYAISQADLVVTPGKTTSDATLALGGDPRKVISLPWIDLEWVAGIGRGRDLASHASARRPSSRVVLCVRNHEPVYNVALVVRAFSTVRSKYPNAVLVLAGHGSLTSSLHKLVNELGLNDAVLFTGLLPRREVIALLDQADIYVSASFSDGTSASLLEAMSRGVPVVVSDIPGNREWVREGENGLLFDPHSDDKLAEKIMLLLDKRMLADQMSRQAEIDLSQKVDWRRDTDRFVSRVLGLITSSDQVQ